MYLYSFVAWVNFTFYIIFLNWNNFFSSIRPFYLSYLNLTVLNLMLSITLAVYIKLFKKMTCYVFSVASVMSNSLQPVDCSLPVSSLCGIFPAIIRDWVAMPSYGGIFPTLGSNLCILHCRRILYCWTTEEAHKKWLILTEFFTPNKFYQHVDIFYDSASICIVKYQNFFFSFKCKPDEQNDLF